MVLLEYGRYTRPSLRIILSSLSTSAVAALEYGLHEGREGPLALE